MVADFEKRFDPEVRQRYLGGTDASKIMRVNKFERGKPYHLWQEKTGREDPPDLSDNDAVYFGAILEDTVARVYSERSGNNVRNVNRTLIHPEHDFIRGHIDRKIEGKNAGLEVKTVGFRSVHEWGEEGTDEIPAHYECQIMHYLAITGYDYFDVAVLVGGQEFRIYKIRRNQQRIDELIDAEVKFWNEHVVTDVPPMPESSDESASAWPMATDEKVAFLSHANETIFRTRHSIKENIDRLKILMDQSDTQIQILMGDAEIMEDMDGFPVASWKNTTRRGLDTKRIKKERPELYEEFASTSEGRTFRIKKRREDDNA
jgi:putative phage-type endonuclease